MKYLQDGMIYMNPRSELTVFLISSNESIKSDCVDSLKNQTVDFNLKEISNVYPMSKAFSEMHLRCETKYFVQVDCDMILNNNAIEKLYLNTKNSSFNTYRISAPLFEIGFGKGGMVKCWKKSIFNFFDFRDVRTVDRDFEKRVRLFGFKKKTINEILGKHVPRHSKQSIFIKSKADVEKWRFLKRKYSQYCGPKISKFLNSNNVNKLELYGILFGILSPKDLIVRSKNLYLENLKYSKLNKFFDFENENTYKIKNMIENNQRLIGETYNDFKFKNKSNIKELTKLIIDNSNMFKKINENELFKILN